MKKKKQGSQESRETVEIESPMLDRAIPILIRMNTNPGNIHFFANLFKVSPRTIQREVQLLRNKGFPIVVDPVTGIMPVVSDYGIPPVGFSLEEAIAVIALFSEMGDRINEPVFSSLRTAYYKLVANLPPKYIDPIYAVQKGLSNKSRSTAAVEDDQDIFDKVLRALTENRTIEIEYSSPAVPGIIRTTLQPYTVLFSRGWYIIGYSGLFRHVRTFKASRILKIRFLDNTFNIPPNFSLDEYLGNAWYMIPEDGPDQEVIIRFSSKVARNVSEVTWHKTQEVRPLPNGQVELRFLVSGLNEISWWILGYGSEAEVLAPPALKTILTDHARKMLEQYTSSSSQNHD